MTMAKTQEIRIEPITHEMGAGCWHISQEARTFFDLWLSGKMVSKAVGFESVEIEINIGGQGEEELADGSVVSSVAVIDLNDVIYRSYYSDCGGQGFADTIKAIDKMPEVGALVIRGNCSGGEDGAAMMINDALVSFGKPSIFWTNYGVALSAGQMVASACDWTFASRATDRFGSIGGLVSFVKMNGKAAGYEVVEVYSDLSPRKNEDYNAAQKGDYGLLKAGFLNPITQNFHDIVRANRGDRLADVAGENVFEGATYLADKALELGLIDGIMNFEGVMAKAIELINNNLKKNTEMFNSIFNAPKLAGLVGLDASQITDAQLTEVAVEFSEKNIAGVILVKQAQFEAAQAATNQLAAKDAEIVKLKAQLAAKDAEIVRLDVTPAVAPIEPRVVAEGIQMSAAQSAVNPFFSETDKKIMEAKAKFLANQI
jgi:ClpP class serine protease